MTKLLFSFYFVCYSLLGFPNFCRICSAEDHGEWGCGGCGAKNEKEVEGRVSRKTVLILDTL